MQQLQYYIYLQRESRLKYRDTSANSLNYSIYKVRNTANQPTSVYDNITFVNFIAILMCMGETPIDVGNRHAAITRIFTEILDDYVVNKNGADLGILFSTDFFNSITRLQTTPFFEFHQISRLS